MVFSYEDSCAISYDGMQHYAIFTPFQMIIQSNTADNVSELGHFPTKRHAAFNTAELEYTSAELALRSHEK